MLEMLPNRKPKRIKTWTKLTHVMDPAAEPHKILIKNKHGEILVGRLHDTGSPEIIILSPGLLCPKELPLIVALAEAIEAAGYSTFRFEYSGVGESGGKFQFGNYHGEVEDLRSVVEYFSTAENRRTAAIVGHSKGANIVLLYASKYHDIDVVVNISGRFYMHEGIKERLGADYWERILQDEPVGLLHGGKYYPVGSETLMERLSIDMGAVCSSIDPSCRVYTIHGTKDKIVCITDAEEFRKVIPNHELIKIEKANHGYTDRRYLDQLVSAVLSCIQTNVQLQNRSSDDDENMEKNV